MTKRQEFLWIMVNVLLIIVCVLSPNISGDELNGILGGVSFSIAAWYFAGLLDLVLFKRKG